MLERLRARAALALMVTTVAWLYAPPGLSGEQARLFGLDFVQLHVHRLAFARVHGLAGWYPRELLGTPFWSNLHSSPLIPTRLLLYLFDPSLGLTVGALVAAELAALFTYAFARRVGLGRAAAATAGGTFAAAGFFASRVLAGHLPLLEAYPALPLLLWLSERPLTSAGLVALAAATGAVALAGHPQLPLYAIATTAAYLLVRRRRAAARPLAALALGGAATAFAWWPMLRLAARSARTLGLDPPANDLALPLGRLAALVAPWSDGWPALVARRPLEPFHGYALPAYFWDTVGYVGLLPIAATLWLGWRAWRGRTATTVGVFLAVAGALALLTALPWRPEAMATWPTILRSPARQLYVVGFALALAAGGGLQALLTAERLGTARKRALLAGLLVALQAIDEGGHARPFVHAAQSPPEPAEAAAALIAGQLGDGRVAIDHTLRVPWNRRWDDVGFFDSLSLAPSYAALLAAGDLPPRWNSEVLDGGVLPAGALAANAVRFVVTATERGDLTLRASLPHARLYEVARPAPRAAWVAAGAARFVEQAEALHELRQLPDAGATRILLPTAASALVPATTATAQPTVQWTRPASDEMRVTVHGAAAPGWLRIVESWDPGWRATVDGRAAPVVIADAHLIALPLGAGDHEVVLRYHTPGVAVGAGMSIVALLLLAWLATSAGRARAR
jgi:hypothetical protein